MKNVKINKTLSNDGINEAIKCLTSFLEDGKCEKKDILRVTLSAEECLMTLQSNLGEDILFQIDGTGFLKVHTVTITVSGKNVMHNFENDEIFEIPLNKMLSEGSISPEYCYENGTNKIKFNIKRKNRLSFTQKSIISIITGALLGILALFLPGNIGMEINEKIVSPVFSMIINVIAGLATIMVFLTVTQSIYLIGDKNSFQKIGRVFFRNTLGKMLLLSIICTLLCIPLFRLGTDGSNTADFFSIFDMIIKIIPTDIVSPFMNGNILQVLFIAVCLGGLLLLLGNRVSYIKRFTDQCCDIVNHATEYILRTIPYSIGISAFMLIVSNEIYMVGSAIKLLIVFFAFIIITMLLNLIFTCLCRKKKIFPFFKDTLPIIAVAFATESSSATLPLSFEICQNKLGIEKRLVSFGIPMSYAIYKLGSVIYRVVLCFGLAEIYGIAITPMWTITCVLVAFCLSIAVPAVPGGGTSMLMLLLTQLSIPAEAFALAMFCGVLMERALTACNVFCDVTELFNIAYKLKMVKEPICE